MNNLESVEKLKVSDFILKRDAAMIDSLIAFGNNSNLPNETKFKASAMLMGLSDQHPYFETLSKEEMENVVNISAFAMQYKNRNNISDVDLDYYKNIGYAAINETAGFATNESIYKSVDAANRYDGQFRANEKNKKIPSLAAKASDYAYKRDDELRKLDAIDSLGELSEAHNNVDNMLRYAENITNDIPDKYSAIRFAKEKSNNYFNELTGFDNKEEKLEVKSERRKELEDMFR